MINIEQLAHLLNNNEDEYHSKPLPIPAFNNKECTFIIEGYDTDTKPDEFLSAMHNLLTASTSIMSGVKADLYQYYEDINSNFEPGDDWYINIKSSDDIFEHIHLGDTLYISRRLYGDKKVYISYCCACDWEEEHGLQIVFKQGKYVNKIGGFNGHLTNSDAYADDSLEDIIYY